MTIADRIRSIVEDRGMSYAELGRRIGKSRLWVSKRLAPQGTGIKADDLALLADGLEVPVATFFLKVQETPSLDSLVNRYDRMESIAERLKGWEVAVGRDDFFRALGLALGELEANQMFSLLGEVEHIQDELFSYVSDASPELIQQLNDLREKREIMALILKNDLARNFTTIRLGEANGDSSNPPPRSSNAFISHSEHDSAEVERTADRIIEAIEEELGRSPEVEDLEEEIASKILEFKQRHRSQSEPAPE